MQTEKSLNRQEHGFLAFLIKAAHSNFKRNVRFLQLFLRITLFPVLIDRLILILIHNIKPRKEYLRIEIFQEKTFKGPIF